MTYLSYVFVFLKENKIFLYCTFIDMHNNHVVIKNKKFFFQMIQLHHYLQHKLYTKKAVLVSLALYLSLYVCVCMSY